MSTGRGCQLVRRCYVPTSFPMVQCTGKDTGNMFEIRLLAALLCAALLCTIVLALALDWYISETNRWRARFAEERRRRWNMVQ